MAAAGMAELKAKVESLGGQIRSIKQGGGGGASSNGGDLTSIQAELKEAKAKLVKLEKEQKEELEKNKVVLKVPKGTKDHHPSEMLLRQHIFKTITRVFELHGAVTIDTPVFELKEILAGKYGEDSKLIYDLKDQGGEICSLRYDLTVPFARFLAMNGTTYQNIKRYHIAKVYRRDNPAMTKGRMREFYQCDYDVAGIYDPMVPDSEVLVVAVSVLEALEIGEFSIKINHRKILDGIFGVCGVPADKTRTISSAVDKLDKLPWADVKKEMTEEKGLDADVADKIGEYVKLKGGEELLEKLLADQTLLKNKTAKEGMQDMRLLFGYLKAYGILERMSFDLSLARGLDYYTGIIYEAVTAESAPPGAVPSALEGAGAPDASANKAAPVANGSNPEDEDAKVGVGSVAAGGRYDNLVAMFSASGQQIPCVGISFGVERLFSILWRKRLAESSNKDNIKSKEVDVFVMSVGDGLLIERMQIAKELWDAGLRTEFIYKAKPKARPQFEIIDRDQVPFAVIIGGNELKEGKIRVKEQLGKEENLNSEGSDKDGQLIGRTEMVNFIKSRMAQRA